MKFVKGVMIGSIVTAGVAMMYMDTTKGGRKRIMKQGKKFLKNISA